MSMMEANRVFVVEQADEAVIAFCNLELDARFVGEEIAQVVVHVVLKRVPGFGRPALFLRHAPVVPGMADNDKLSIRGTIVEKELDARDETAFYPINGFGGEEIVALLEIFVNRVRDEITEKRQDDGLDGAMLAQD